MDSKEQAEAKLYSQNEMKTKLAYDERLTKALIPEFGVGCRRPTPGNGFLEALGKPNVKVATDAISEIVPEGVKLSTGEVIKIDTFICATGFDISFFPRFKMTGRKGAVLSEQWRTKPEAYFSLAAENFPNYFSEFSSKKSCQVFGTKFCSVPWSQCSCWARICPSNHRALYKVPHQLHKEDPGAGHSNCYA